MNNMEQTPIDPKFLVDEQGKLINQLTHENLSLRAYINQILADNQLMIDKVNELAAKLPKDEEEEKHNKDD